MAIKLREYQKDAIRDVIHQLAEYGRTKCIMPCGTGKTFVAAQVAKRIRKSISSTSRTLIVVPSLALIRQTLDEWLNWKLVERALTICSDQSMVREAQKRFDLPNPTTDFQEIGASIRKRSASLVIFSTYHSSERIADAYAEYRLPAIDLGIFDEAHRMAGKTGMFSTLLDNDRAPIRKRIFLTATPRIVKESTKSKHAAEEFACMDDESLFGIEAYRYKFRDAIEEGWLSDYRVILFCVRESELRDKIHDEETVEEAAKRYALAKVMSTYPDVRKVLTFHNRNNRAATFAARFCQTMRSVSAQQMQCRTWWLSGKDDSEKRADALLEFGNAPADTYAVLSNCSVLQEGVDCPAIDGVFIADPKRSAANVVQAVGRGIRPYPGKFIASIILPIFIPESPETQIEDYAQSSAFDACWSVLRALQLNDERVTCWINDLKNRPFTPHKKNGDNKIELIGDIPVSMANSIASSMREVMIIRFADDILITVSMIWEEMQKFYDEYGRWPRNSDKIICEQFGKTWHAINSGLSARSYGNTEKLSLAQLRDKMLGIDGIITVAMIWEEMQKFYDEYGRWPASDDTTICERFGKTWTAINQRLVARTYGNTEKLSLAKLRNKMLGLAESITVAMIWEEMQKFYDKYGRWPRSRDTIICEQFGKTWNAINSGLSARSYGNTEKLSLAQLRDKMLGIDGIITVAMIWEEMQKFYDKYGRWPTHKDKIICERFGKTWCAINAGLSVRSYGNTEKLSLAKLRDKMLGEDVTNKGLN